MGGVVDDQAPRSAVFAVGVGVVGQHAGGGHGQRGVLGDGVGVGVGDRGVVDRAVTVMVTVADVAGGTVPSAAV